ncbi:hypothetical protein [Pseudomonas sp. HY7a-MNA-CIBAN-0227]|uniref:hypothetical protein n=1 Tax=Pseudomonas sp. HY7a-MNA-CIBAN-0227 TaxID=3140474 RepID=UPI00332D1E73
MRRIKLAFAFMFVFSLGMTVDTVSVKNTSLSMQTSTAEAAQATTTSKGKANSVNLYQPDLGLVKDKSAAQNFVETNNKWIRGLTIVFGVLMGFVLTIGVGLRLKMKADEGHKISLASIFITALAASLCFNSYRIAGLFLPDGNDCSLSGFASGQCGATAMPALGALADEITGATASAGGGSSNLDFLGDTYSLVNSVSYTIAGIGVIYFIIAVLLLRRMSYGDERKDYGKVARMLFSSVVIMNHRGLIDSFVVTLKALGFWS